MATIAKPVQEVQYPLFASERRLIATLHNLMGNKEYTRSTLTDMLACYVRHVRLDGADGYDVVTLMTELQNSVLEHQLSGQDYDDQ